MNWTAAAPLVYLLAGVALGRSRWDARPLASHMLSRWVIPAVIVFNVATHESGVFIVMLGITATMLAMLVVRRIFDHDPARNLCFFYLNIGWLGLPVVSVVFGPGAATLYVAAYVGNSIFGNSVGAALLRSNSAGGLHRIALDALRSPAALGLLLGLLCMPLAPWIKAEFGLPYALLKWLLSFLGLAVLGMWMASTRLALRDFAEGLREFVLRVLVMGALLAAFAALCSYWGATLVTNNLPALFMMALLPPAANIVVLETHYRGTGYSAPAIASGTVISLVAVALYAGAALHGCLPLF